MEDQHHIIKRIGFSTRKGGPKRLDMKCFDEALKDSSSGLTDAALRGDHKQSVREAEVLLSHHVAKSLKKLGFTEESRYVQTVANWHEAHDGRAIKTPGAANTRCARQRARSKANYEMLAYLLDDFMPWHRQTYDFRLIDINRYLLHIDNIIHYSLYTSDRVFIKFM